MSDPLSDPRAARLLAADENEVATLASAFQRVASQAQTAAAGLRGASGDASWTGKAADAFRTQLGKLPGDLDRVQHSYGEAATALRRYGGELGPVRSRFQSIAAQLSSARSSLLSAQTDLSSARTTLGTASSAAHASPTTPAVLNAHSAVQSATGAVNRLQGEVSGLESHAYRMLDEFDTIRGHARSTVSSAAGIAPSHSWLSGVLHAVGNFMSGAGHVLINIGKGVVHAAENLPGDVMNVFEHPLDLHDWAKLGEDVGTVAGAVALVAAVIVCPADALGLEAVAGVAEAADGAAGAVALGAGIEKTAADSGLVLEGKGSMGAVAFDVFGLATSKIEPGVGSAESDVEHLSAKSGALEQYGLYRAEGASHAQAYAALSDEQRSVITHSAARLSNPARLQYMRSSTLERLEAATAHANKVKLAGEVGHTVLDKGTEAVKGAVLPEEPATCGG